MRIRLVAAAIVLASCGGGDATTTTSASTTTAAPATTTTAAPTATTTAAATTTTTPDLSDPRFTETVLSARVAVPADVTVPGDPASHLALFYRSQDGDLVVVMTGFEPATLDCGWILIFYGGSDVLTASTFDEGNWQQYANQPWATSGATAEPRCEQAFLEEGALRADIATAVQCGDYLAVVADQMDIDPTFTGLAVATPQVDLIVDQTGGDPVRLEALPWNAHPGASPTTGDLGEVAPGVLECSLPG